MSKKVVILGDSGVGKTSIFQRFFYDKYDPELLASMGASFKTTTVEIPPHIVKDMKRRVTRMQTQKKEQSPGSQQQQNLDSYDPMSRGMSDIRGQEYDQKGSFEGSDGAANNVGGINNEVGYEAEEEDGKTSEEFVDHIKLNLWDTAGQEKFRSLTKSYLQNAEAAIVVYDCTFRESFESAKVWVQDLIDNAQNPFILIALASNKCDMMEEQQVSYQEGAEFMKEINAQIFKETSAKENLGIGELF